MLISGVIITRGVQSLAGKDSEPLAEGKLAGRS